MSAAPPKLKVFISYSHRDDVWRGNLDTHLSLLKREGVLDVWHDRRLVAGEEWAQTIDERLRDADLVLLLVSADFIQSDYCFGLEMTTALAQHEAGRSWVVPIIVRQCDWQTAPFAKLQAAPRDGVPVATHPRGTDEALTEVAKEIRRLAADIAAHRRPEADAPVEAGKPVAIEAPRPRWSRHRRLVGAAGAVAAVAVVAVSVAFALSSSRVGEGRRELRIGDYAEATARFERAAAVNPLDGRARRGLRLARLGLMIPELDKKRDEFSRELEALGRGGPRDPQVLLFRGDLALDDYRRAGAPGNVDAAIEAYRAAIERDPAFAEAHARLAHVYRWMQKDLAAAAQELREAIKVGGEAAAGSRRYQHDLASALAAQGRTSDALRLYEGNGEFVLSAVEAGMLLWSAEAADALGRARSTLAGALDRQDRLGSAGNQYAWLLAAGDEGVYFGLPVSKVCFVTLALAAAQRLVGDTASADSNKSKAVEGHCEAVRENAALIVCDRLSGAAGVAGRQAVVAGTRTWLGCAPGKPAARAAVESGASQTRTLVLSGRYRA